MKRSSYITTLKIIPHTLFYASTGDETTLNTEKNNNVFAFHKL